MDDSVGFSREAWQQDGAKWTKLAANKEQRLGRVGRVKKGIFVLLLVEESKLPCASLFLSDAFCRVHAMSSYHEQIGLSDLSLCNVPDHLVDEAAIFVSELKLSDFDMRLALTALPVSLSDARILFSGRNLGIGYETAFFVALKAVGKYKQSTKFEFSELLQMAGDWRLLAKNTCPIRNIFRVIELSKDLCWRLYAQPSKKMPLISSVA